ncbi:hypothetical protein [Microcoleus sp. FACHB-SPT15]|nr:hypothetical protein [Microcoleus sp. FACHB-SPT15]
MSQNYSGVAAIKLEIALELPITSVTVEGLLRITSGLLSKNRIQD